MPLSFYELQLADILRNLLLFAPLGAGLAWLGLRAGWALVVGAGLSAAVELLQATVPTRTASFTDVLSDGTGTLLGYALVRTLPLWLQPSPARSRGLALAAGLFAALVFFATARSFEPALSSARYFGHFTPVFSYRSTYDGEVLAARLGGVALPRRQYLDLQPLAPQFVADFDLELDVVAAPPPFGQAPIFLISQERGRHIFEIASQSEDLIFHFRHRGKRLGLEGALVRWRGALAGLEGRRVHIGADRRGADLCLTVDDERRCGLGFSVGDGWQLFGLDVPWLSPWRSVLAVVWVALLFLPIGYFARPSASGATAVGLALAGLLLAPAAGGLVSTPLPQVVAALLALAAGGLARRALVDPPAPPATEG